MLTVFPYLKNTKNRYKSKKLHLQNIIKDLICVKLLNLCLSKENVNILKKIIIKLFLRLRNKSQESKMKITIIFLINKLESYLIYF